MKKGGFKRYKLFFVIVAFILVPNLRAQTGNGNGNGNGNNTVIVGADPFALTVTTSSPTSLNFGAFVNVNGGNIIIDPSFPGSFPIANPTDFIVIQNGTGPVLFEVSNQATPLKVVNLTCQFTPLSKGTSSLGLELKFESSRPLTTTSTSPSSSSYTFTINELNPATIYMGGILTVAPGDLPGNYEGNVIVTIDYP